MLGWFKELVSPVKDLISEYVVDKDKANELNAKIDAMENTLESKIVDGKTKVMLAELNQDDLYTKRARPTIVYVGLGIAVFNSIMMWVATLLDKGLPGLEVMGAFWAAWGSAVGIYGYQRSKRDKRRGL